MEATLSTEVEAKKNFSDNFKELPNQIWETFKSFGWIKRILIISITWWIVNDLTEGMADEIKKNKDDIFKNLTSLPKLLWTNFWNAPSGKKLFLALGAWWVVKNLFPAKSK
jgi:hypothetical protein